MKTESGRKRLIAFGLLLALSLLMATPSFGQMDRVRVSTLPLASFLPLFVAMDKGYFEEEKVKVETAEVAIPKILAAISGGSIEVGFQTYLPVFVANEKGFDFIIIAPAVKENIILKPGTTEIQDSANGLMVLEESGITGMKDLKGKTIGVGAVKGDIDWLSVSEMLSRNGVDPGKEINWVDMPFHLMGASLRGKRIDAGWFVEPFKTFEREKGGVRALCFCYAELSLDPAVEVFGAVALRTWVQRNPDSVDRFVRGYRKGVDYVLGHPAEMPELIAKYTKLPPPVIKKMVVPAWTKYSEVKGVQIVHDLALKWGLLKNKEDVRKFLHKTALR